MCGGIRIIAAVGCAMDDQVRFRQDTRQQERSVGTSRPGKTGLACVTVGVREALGPSRPELGDDRDVPLICPTCQRQLKASPTDCWRLLCMGLFSIFLVGHQSTA